MAASKNNPSKESILAAYEKECDTELRRMKAEHGFRRKQITDKYNRQRIQLLLQIGEAESLALNKFSTEYEQEVALALKRQSEKIESVKAKYDTVDGLHLDDQEQDEEPFGKTRSVTIGRDFRSSTSPAALRFFPDNGSSDSDADIPARLPTITKTPYQGQGRDLKRKTPSSGDFKSINSDRSIGFEDLGGERSLHRRRIKRDRSVGDDSDDDLHIQRTKLSPAHSISSGQHAEASEPHDDTERIEHGHIRDSGDQASTGAGLRPLRRLPSRHSRPAPGSMKLKAPPRLPKRRSA